MINADFYMFRMIDRIFEEGHKDINPRPKYADGTPAHTISVNHTFRSYDLAHGDFPISSIKILSWSYFIVNKSLYGIKSTPTMP